MSEEHWHLIQVLKDPGSPELASREMSVVSTHKWKSVAEYYRDKEQMLAGPCYCDDKRMGMGG